MSTTPNRESRPFHEIVAILLVCMGLAIAFTTAALDTPMQAQNQGPKGALVRRSAVTNTSNTVVGTGVIVDGIHCLNTNAAVTYLQMFNAATATTVTPGTTVPDASFGIPSNATDPQLQLMGTNFWFGNGVKVIATTTATGSTAPGTAIDCNFVLR